MTGRINNALLAFLGIASFARKKILKLYETFIKEGAEVKEGSEFLKKRWSRIESVSLMMEDLITKAMEKTNIATRNQLDELNKKVDRLLKEAKTR